MNINIDEKQLQEALDKQATTGVRNAMEGYAIRSAIEKAVAEAVLPDLIRTSVVEAASQIDIARLTQCLAKEMSRSVVKGVQAVMQDTMIEVILKMRGIPDYEREKREKARAEIKATVFDNTPNNGMNKPTP